MVSDTPLLFCPTLSWLLAPTFISCIMPGPPAPPVYAAGRSISERHVRHVPCFLEKHFQPKQSLGRNIYSLPLMTWHLLPTFLFHFFFSRNTFSDSTRVLYPLEPRVHCHIIGSLHMDWEWPRFGCYTRTVSPCDKIRVFTKLLPYSSICHCP